MNLKNKKLWDYHTWAVSWETYDKVAMRIIFGYLQRFQKEKRKDFQVYIKVYR